MNASIYPMFSLIKNNSFFTLLIMAFPATSHALSCVEQDSASAVIRETLGTALAVPADAPNGTIIWESSPRSTRVRCADNMETGTRELVYFYPNPAQVSVGQGIRVGIRYNNTLITQATGKYSTGFDSMLGCNWINCRGWNRADFTLSFTVYIEKYGAVPQSGQATTRSEYRVFQLDGVGGMNNPAPKNLNYLISGMQNIRFVPCSPNLTIAPSTVRLPRPSSHNAKNGALASSATFSLSTRKNCDTPYTVNARFTPKSGTVINNLLVPTNNSSVGISLVRADNQEKIPFSTWFKLTDLAGTSAVRTDFRADLIWRDKTVIGPFDAAVAVDMFYK
ncbi:fimbrial protein [Pseudomonas chlororaphis]|uniref:fimbrial protein n=1 Tax=Pseudomonas chlororaphis TaxID=587753 RepID=UPI0023663084|nr:hypothetical protein [Pseudomonas chlororaphis]WDG54073.1 hypothetical protein PUP76_30105 [Pseudomonas chlororaphis]WDH90755.1 hypothetical protein PUP74_12240 [Pseudomonas chlororaphis]